MTDEHLDILASKIAVKISSDPAFVSSILDENLRLLTIEEVAQLTPWSVRTIRKMIPGKIPMVKVNGAYTITRKALDQALQSLTKPKTNRLRK